MKNSIKNKGRSSANAAKARRKKASSSLKTLKRKQPTSEELRQVLGGLGSRRDDVK
jgi:hypothetical protein